MLKLNQFTLKQNMKIILVCSQKLTILFIDGVL